MKKLLVLVATLFSFSVFARESVSFTYFGNEGWGQSYYACDYVEARTEKVLEMFGATEIEVRCSGGIEFGRYWGPVNVRTSFELPVLTGTEVAEEVTFKGDSWNPACGLNVTIVKKLLPKFSNVSVVKKSDSCAFSRSNYSYVFSILR